MIKGLDLNPNVHKKALDESLNVALNLNLEGKFSRSCSLEFLSF